MRADVGRCLLIDVAEADASFGAASAELIESKRPEGLTICPVSYVELAPVFNGDAAAQNEFLFHLGAACPAEWSTADTSMFFRDSFLTISSSSIQVRASP